MKKTLETLKDRLSMAKYTRSRNSLLKYVLGTIGTIEEQDDKIICHVEQKLLEKHAKKRDDLYELWLEGMNIGHEGSKATIDKLNLNKPVYYVFENINFSTGVQIYSTYAHVLFKNCTFNKNVRILCADDIVFEDNKYSDDYPVYFWNDRFLTGDRIKKITFVNDNFINSVEKPNTNFGMKIKADTIEFINTNIDSKYSMDITAKKTIITDSKISAKSLYVESPSIACDNSSIYATAEVMIENKNEDFQGKIESPIISYNGVELSAQGTESVQVDDETIQLQQARLQTLQALRSLSNYCQQANNSALQKAQNSLEKRPFRKVINKN